MACPLADCDEPAGDRAAFHDSVHDVRVNKKSNAMLVFILFSTEENHVSFLCRCFAKVLPFHFTESRNASTVPVHFMFWFLEFSCSCWCPCVQCTYGDVVSSTELGWCTSNILNTSVVVYDGRRRPCWPARQPIRCGLVVGCYFIVTQGQGTIWQVQPEVE